LVPKHMIPKVKALDWYGGGWVWPSRGSCKSELKTPGAERCFGGVFGHGQL